MEFIIAFIVLVILGVWIGATIAGLLILLPALVVVGVGMAFGLNWWQSLIAGFVVWVIIQALVGLR